MKIEGVRWFTAPNDIFSRESGLQGVYERLVLVYLYRRAGPDGGSWPSYTTIAKDCGMSQTQAKLTVKSLEGKGFVHLAHRKNERGADTSNYYSLGAMSPPAPPPVTTRHPPLSPPAPEVLLTSEVPPSEGKGRSTPASSATPTPRRSGRPTKSDLANLTAKTFISEAARALARTAAEKFGYPTTAHRLHSEAVAAQQLFDAGIGPGVLRDVLERRERLPSLWKLHDWIDVRALGEISDESERDQATQKIIDQIWKKP